MLLQTIETMNPLCALLFSAVLAETIIHTSFGAPLVTGILALLGHFDAPKLMNSDTPDSSEDDHVHVSPLSIVAITLAVLFAIIIIIIISVKLYRSAKARQHRRAVNIAWTRRNASNPISLNLVE